MQRTNWYLLLISSLLFSFLVGCSSSTTTATDTQRELMEHAQYIEHAAEKAEHLWPDFWAADTPFVVYVRQGPALLVSQQAPTGDYQQTGEGYYYFEQGLPRLNGSFQIDYQLDDVVATAVNLNESPAGTLSLLFHEAFHGYQARSFNRTPVEEFVEADIFRDPQVRAVLQLRRLLLRQALSASEPELGGLIDDLLTMDHLLVLLMGADAVERMHYLEIHEGTAEYVGLAAKALLNADYDIEHAIGHLMQVLPEGIHHSAELRQYIYGTGAAQTRIAMRMDKNAGEQINAASSLHALLAQWRNYVQPDENRINDMLARYPFEATVAWAYQHSDPDTALTLEQFAALSESTLDFAIHLNSEQATEALDINFSSGPDGMTQPQRGSLVLPKPESVSIHANMTSLLIQGAATHIQPPIEQPRVLRLQVKVKSLPELCEQASSCQLAKLDFNWQGVQFSHESEVSIRQNGSHLHIDMVEL